MRTADKNYKKHLTNSSYAVSITSSAATKVSSLLPKWCRRYKKYGVDPKTKLLLFSDSLDFDRAQKLYEYFCDKTKVSFGIGTFCSNDTEENALNIVIKLQYVNGRPVAKLSDDIGKAMCRDADYLEYLKRSVEFRLDREKNK